MKTTCFLFCLTAVASASCHSNSHSKQSFASYTLAVAPHTRLAVTAKRSKEGVLPFTYYEYRLVPGRTQVFEVSSYHGDGAHTDGAAVETLVFEVADTATVFHLQGQAFLDHNALYVKRCMCVTPEANKLRRVPAGNTISGRWLTPRRWRIQSAVGDIDFTDTLEVQYQTAAEATYSSQAGPANDLHKRR
jgi:hypothetical protein